MTGRELRAQLKAQQGRNKLAPASNPESRAVATNTAYFRWRVTLPDGSPFEVCCTPEITAEEMHTLYAGALLEPLADAPRTE